VHLGLICYIQGDHLSGKPGNVREFDSYHGNVRDFTKNQRNVGGKNLVREKLPKTVAYLRPYRYLVGVCSVSDIKCMVSDHAFLPPPLTVNTSTGMM